MAFLLPAAPLAVTVMGASSAAVAAGAVGATLGATAAVAGTSAVMAAGGAGLWGGLATAWSFVTSPGFSFITKIAGFGLELMGQKSYYDQVAWEYARREQMQQYQLAIAQQDVKIEKEKERLRQRLIAEAGRVREGEIAVAGAFAGQELKPGSSIRRMQEDLASEVARKKLRSQYDSDLFQRELLVRASSIDPGLTRARASMIESTRPFAYASTVLTTGSKLVQKFKVTKEGGFGYRM